MSKKICHITTVHSRYDVRIFYKQCKSLSKNYDVSLIVADGLGDESVEGVKIYDIGLRQLSRLKRAKIDSAKAFSKALELDCELYHFHDPELIIIGDKLRRRGYKTIYDVHEDLPRQIYGKPYMKSWQKPLLAKFIEVVENRKAKKFDFVLTATPFIRDRFRAVNKNVIDVNNFPILSEFEISADWGEKSEEACYIGGLARVRGIKEIVQAFDSLPMFKLNLAGVFEDEVFEREVKQLPSWKHVNELGFIDRAQVSSVLRKSKLGLVTLYPIVNYIDALPVKMFEYMIAGIPVISSNIELWKNIIETENCGICVDPMNSVEISAAIKFIIENPKEARQMGKNGQKAVIEKYNWDIESEKLLNVYKELL